MNIDIKEVANIYSEFNYPTDMGSFIYYMPKDHSNNMSLEENSQVFLENEKKLLS